jgi:hypothetical protein
VLHVDAKVLSTIPVGVETPEPKLTDRAMHQAHRHGKYRPLNQLKNEKHVFFFHNNNLEGHLALMDGNRGDARPLYSQTYQKYIPEGQSSWLTLG